MKVLFINTVYQRGSTGRIVKELGDALEARGDSYMVAYGRGEKTDDPHCYYIGSNASSRLHAGLSRFTDRAGFYSRVATRKLLDFIREYQPDVIHLHNLHGYYLNLNILFRYLKHEYKGKVVWTLHDCWSMTGHCAHFTWAGCDKWQTECHHCPQKSSYPKSQLLDRSRRNYLEKKALLSGLPNLTVVTVSQWLKGVAEKSFLKEHPIRCIYNGIDINKFQPAENRIKEELGICGKKMILSVSSGWGQRKGLPRVLEAAEIAPENWHFVLIGMSQEQITAMPKNVTGLPKIWDQKKLIEYYSAADVFFHPSIQETFGLVTAEAMACGTGAVVYNSTACPELILDDSCGRVLELSATPEEAAEALRQGMTCKSQEGKKHFPLSQSTDSYLALYNE